MRITNDVSGLLSSLQGSPINSVLISTIAVVPKDIARICKNS